MKSLITRFQKDESGATAIEYGLIAALLSVAIIGVLTLASTELVTLCTTISTALASATP